MKLPTVWTLCLVSVIMTSMFMNCEIMNSKNCKSYQFPPPFSNLKEKGWGNTEGSQDGATGSETTAPETNMTNLAKVLENNKKWVA